MTQDIIVKFGFGSRVNVKCEKEFAIIITRIMIAPDGVSYEGMWMYEGQRRTDWFFEHELKGAARRQMAVGFGDKE